MIENSIFLQIAQRVVMALALFLLVDTVLAQTQLQPAHSVSAESSANAITVYWTLPLDQKIIRARLYRQTQSPQTPAAGRKTVADGGELLATLEPQQTRYIDKFAEPGKRYLYRVKLFGKGNISSPWSLPALASLRDEQAPDPVSGLQFSALDASHVKLQWKASPAPDVEGYRIYRALPDAKPLIVARIAAQKGEKQQAIIAQTANTETTFQYRVAAVDLAGNRSPLSEAVSVRLADRVAPRSPLQLRLRQLDQMMHLEWLENSEDDLAGYRVYRQLESDKGGWQLLTPKPLIDNQFVDDDIQPHRSYRYRVSALDRYGNESPPGRGQGVRTLGFKQTVLAPQDVRIGKTRSGQPRLQWRLKQGDGVKLAGVIVERSDGGDFSAVSNLIKQLSFTDSTARRGVAYQYRLQALAVDGQASPFSERVIWKGGRP